MSGGLRVEVFSTCFDVMSWEIWTSPKRHLSTVVSVGRVYEPKICAISTKQQIELALGTERTLIALTCWANHSRCSYWRGNRWCCTVGFVFKSHTFLRIEVVSRWLLRVSFKSFFFSFSFFWKVGKLKHWSSALAFYRGVVWVYYDSGT